MDNGDMILLGHITVQNPIGPGETSQAPVLPSAPRVSSPVTTEGRDKPFLMPPPELVERPTNTAAPFKRSATEMQGGDSVVTIDYATDQPNVDETAADKKAAIETKMAQLKQKLLLAKRDPAGKLAQSTAQSATSQPLEPAKLRSPVKFGLTSMNEAFSGSRVNYH